MFILLAVAICFVGTSLHTVEAASCHMREMDLCFATILLGGAEGPPTNDEEMDRVCEPILEGIQCLGNYSASCFTSLFQEVFDMVMAEPKKYQAEMCTHGTDERAKYLKNAPCYQRVWTGDNIRPHIDDLMNSLETATQAHFQERLPILCCGIQRMFSATTGMVEKECGKDVLEEGGVMIGMSFSSLSDVFCRGYGPDTPKCSGILPPAGTPSKGAESNLQIIQFLNTALSNL